MTLKHRIDTRENPTELTTPVTSSAGLRVAVGVAPINLTEDPEAAVNTPILVTSFGEAQEKLGYSDDFDSYNRCDLMDVSFRVFNIAPIVFINVLDPGKHKKTATTTSVKVDAKKAVINESGILLKTLVVKNGTSALKADTDYVAAFNDDGDVEITLLTTEATAGVATLTITAEKVDPSMVTKDDIIGGFETATGKDKGIEAIREVYPKLGMVPGLLLAPRWSKDAAVAAALAAKTESLNGVFPCECVVDIDTAKAKSYTDVKTVKEDMGFMSNHGIAAWPMSKLGEKIYAYSSVVATVAAYTDYQNGDIPYKSPSNEDTRMAGAVLEDGTEVYLDTTQAEVVNSCGVVTLIHDNGWRTYGNETAAAPQNTDPKDYFIPCRRMMSWYRNHFILTYKSKVDDPTNKRLNESVAASENIYLNGLKSDDKIAGGEIKYRAEDNSAAELNKGHVKYYTRIGFFAPAEHIEDVIGFDPNYVLTALGG